MPQHSVRRVLRRETMRRPGGSYWLAPLPRTLPPLCDETYISYTARIAAANHLDHHDVLDLLYYNVPEADPEALVAAFSTVTGRDRRTLLIALPELRRPQNSVGLPLRGRPRSDQLDLQRTAAPCRFCAAAKGVTCQPQIWTTADRNLCLRHQVWIGEGTLGYDDQLDLRDQPEIVAAQRGHQRLIRRYGRHHAYNAVAVAGEVWSALEWDHGCSRERDARTLRHDGRTGRDFDYHDPLHHAARYPEIVELARMLACSHWRQAINAPKPRDRDPKAFHAEFSRRITADADPSLVARLVRRQLRRPLSTPDTEDTDAGLPHNG